MVEETVLKGNCKIRVMLVDDNPVFSDTVVLFLKRQPELIVVGAARNGEEALAHIQNLQPQVILLDLDMLDLTRLETIPRLRSALPQVGIVGLTLLDENIYQQAARAGGADEVVSKSTLATDLLPAIRRVARDVRGAILRLIKRSQ